MKFSVILATLNRSKDAKEAVLSILNGECNDLEVIVVDQSSDDETYNALKEYIGDKVIYKKVDFKGLSKARNYGIKLAKGEYITLMDDDATYDKTFLKKASEYLKEGYDILSGEISDPKVKKTFNPLMEKYDKLDINTRNIDICCSASLVISKKIADKICGFDEKLGAGEYFGAGEETDFLIRALEETDKVLYVRELKVYHPYPSQVFDEGLYKKIYSYALGEGAMNKKAIKISKDSSYFKVRFIKRILRSTAAFIVFGLKGNREKIKFHKVTLKGLIGGFREYKY